MPKKEFKQLSKRQQGIMRFMEKYIERMGYPPTIREIGEATSINSTSVVNYNLNKLVNAGYLERSDRVSRGLRLVGSSGAGSKRSRVKASSDTIAIPLIGHIVASAPVEVPEDIGHFIDEDDMIEVPPMLLGNVSESTVFALRVEGESMIDAMIQDGDIVIIRHQQTAHHGDMVAVWLDERGETTLKYFFPEGDKVRLQPAHPTMDPIYVDAAHCQIKGKVLSVIRQME